jgi:hypothetical protein
MAGGRHERLKFAAVPGSRWRGVEKRRRLFMMNSRYEFGDRVRHIRRPEWGVGTVTRTEDATVGGTPVQRLSISFPNGGLKKLMASHAELERVGATNGAEAAVGVAEGNGELRADAGIEPWERMRQSGWLTALADRKIDEVMVMLPEEVRDPFASIQKRVASTLSLYRFDRSGRGIIDWAVAQTGLSDPLSRFSRPELEQHFDRWARERDLHLARLLETARYETGDVRQLLQSAPPAAREAVRRISSGR